MATPRTPYKIDDLLFQLTDRDLRVLEALEKYRLLDTRLIQRLEFPSLASGTTQTDAHATVSSATRTTTRVLGRLEGHGLITRVRRRVGGAGHGSTQTVWQLAAAGERLLRARRGEPGRRRYVDPGTGFLAHTLDVATYAITLIEASRRGNFELLELEAEPHTWRSFHAAHGGAITLKPDLFVVAADSESETHCFVEIDRATEHLPAILRKCRTYQQHFQTGALQAENDGLYPLVVWATPDQARADNIRLAIAGDKTLNADLFHTGESTATLRVVAPYAAESSRQSKGGNS